MSSTERQKSLFSRARGTLDSGKPTQDAETLTSETGIHIHESGIEKQEPIIPKNDSGVEDKGSETIDIMKLTEAMEVGFRDPRVSAYSIIARTILEYKDRTEFRFVPGDYVSTILEEAFRSAHTELCEAIEKTVQSDPKWQELLKKRRKAGKPFGQSIFARDLQGPPV